MKNGFSNTDMLTNQGIFHVTANHDPSCQRHVVKYLQDGIVGFDNGEVCGADFATVSDFGTIFGLPGLEGVAKSP
jgi:hypothetical protein